MRIQKIRFTNLNSLSGTWEVDLTHPVFVSNGIFAITGPTGAGKTTILDAICLALYGRTPRLNKLTQNSNEIISRRTSECSAEVTFETRSGRFCCSWSQRRARNRAEGELQSPKHQISVAHSGEILETKRRAVAERVEQVTGMDFDRFTRSMMLAQGEFAAFLQATPDDRAPILEQITGTGIYSQISMRVHERTSKEYRKRDMLSAELEGMQLLSEEDAQQLATDLMQKRVQETELGKKIAQQNQAIAWLDGITRLEQALEQIEEQKQALQVRQKAFAADGEKVRRAILAQELAGEYAGLQSIRHAQQVDRDSYERCLEEHPRRTAVVKQAEEAMKRDNTDLEQKKEKHKKALPIIQKTRELDLKLREKARPIQAAEDALKEQNNALKMLRTEHNVDSETLERQRTALQEVKDNLAANRADEGLVEHLAGIRSQFDTLSHLHTQNTTKLGEIKKGEEQVTEEKLTCKRQIATLEKQQRELTTLESRFEQIQKTRNDTLANRDLSDWRHSLSDAQEKKRWIEKAIEAVEQQAKFKQALKRLHERHTTLDAKKRSLAAKLQNQVEKCAGLEREKVLLERQCSLLERIQNFEAARHQLQDGEPCPLCGAREHPFAMGNIPIPDETRLALQTLSLHLQTASNLVQTWRIEQVKIDKDLEQVSSQKTEYGDGMATTETQIKQNCQRLHIEASRQDLAEHLPQRQAENVQTLESIDKRVKNAEILEKEMDSIRQSLDKKRTLVAKTAQLSRDTAHKKALTEQGLERSREEVETLNSQRQQILDKVQQEVSAYGIEVVSVDLLDQIQRELTQRRKRWIAWQEENRKLGQQIAALEIKTGHQETQIQKYDAELEKHRELLSNLQQERNTLEQERQDLFGHKDPATEENNIFVAMEEADKKLEATRHVYHAETQALNTLNDKRKELDKAMTARKDSLDTAEGDFLVRLGKFGFAHENDYQAAQLPEERRKSLMQQAKQLADEQTELQAKAQEKTTQLAAERQTPLTDQSRADLDQARTTLMTEQKHRQQEIGGIHQKLKENDHQKRKQQERLKIMEAQARECMRWRALHDLIGSSDGKKYRNFAQGLTFETMIGYANRQLQKLTDRYLLTQDQTQPLVLNVIDSYQAGEIRSTKNLSGGESFIVSLALALGLSQMASKNVRVDSLFLDEGFGTLDEESLDTALETLAGLHQDGKLIGVISHVPALKERMRAQIQVIAQTNGKSIIRGHGCSNISQRGRLTGTA